MKKSFTLLLTAAMMAGTAIAQDVSVGIERPLVPGDSRVYDDFAYITTSDFNKSANGLTVEFCQSAELEATLAKDETSESGYARSNLRYHGNGYEVDYVWKIQCSEGGAKNHADGTEGSENYTFGFNLTVADGTEFTVSALEVDLLLEQNPWWIVRLVDEQGNELYSTDWVTKTGGYNSAQWGAGWFGRFTTTGVTFETELNGGENGIFYYPCQESPTNLPENLVLTAGKYKVLCTVDYNNENVKGLSFDHLKLEGSLSGGGSTPADNVIGIARPLVPGDSRVYDDFAYITTSDFNISANGLTVEFCQSAELEATLAKDETSESGYARSNLRYHGNGYEVDYVWKIQCSEGGAKNHADGTEGSENYTFGFNLTVGDGKQFTISALEVDLLLEQNPWWIVRLVDEQGNELYSTDWVTKTGGYNSAQWGAGWFGRFTTTGVSFETELNGGENGIFYYPCQESPTNLPENLVLTAGKYKVLCTVDYNNENVKGLSFDHLTLEGTLSGADAISEIFTENKSTNNQMYSVSGQRIVQPVKGQMYILNGKKYIAK